MLTFVEGIAAATLTCGTCAGHKVVESEVTVSYSAPSPVDMVFATCVTSVYIEGVTRRLILVAQVVSAVNHWSAVLQLGHKKLVPLCVGVFLRRLAIAVATACQSSEGEQLGVAISEFMARVDNVFAHCTTTTGRITHVFCLTNIAHQPRNGFSLSCGVASRVVVEHVVPVGILG